MPRNERRCPYCGSPLPETRLGIKLTPLKAKIFDLVQRGGVQGVLMDDLYAVVHQIHPMSRKTLKAHFFQINSRIASAGYRIYSRNHAVRLISIWKGS